MHQQIPAKLQPIQQLDTEGPALLLFDIDGTVTTKHGQIPAKVYAALEDLRSSGLLCVPVTGRPGGWCDMIARTWPVDGVVGENGGLAFRLLGEGKAMERRFLQEPAKRLQNRERLSSLGKNILSQVPGCALASDQPYRDLDLAIDFCEDVPPLPQFKIDHIEKLFAQAGAVHKVSSIHVNGWFGDWDKRGMVIEVAKAWFGLDLQGIDRERAIFIGDSPNDEPMFEFFPKSCAVANIQAFIDRLNHPPAYVTQGMGAQGFVELAEHILTTRKA